jgi:hypothetical protein
MMSPPRESAAQPIDTFIAVLLRRIGAQPMYSVIARGEQT